MEGTKLSTPLRELDSLIQVYDRDEIITAQPFNSPEGIRLIDTEPCPRPPVQHPVAFNSPEGIRLIDTKNLLTVSRWRDITFNSPEGIRLIDTKVNVAAPEADE